MAVLDRVAVVDIDNTLWQFCDALYSHLRRVNERFPTPDNWTHWDLWQNYCSADEFFAAIEAVHFAQDCDDHLPYPEAREFLLNIRASGYRITIASHRSSETREQTERWLQRHGLVYDELHLSFDKTCLFNSFANVVVDDAPNVLEEARARNLVATGLRFPWNEACVRSGFNLFDSLDEVLHYILQR